MQYIIVGNFIAKNNVSLIMLEYPARARLKIFAKAAIVELKDNPPLYDFLDLNDYKFRSERMMGLTFEAYDWNCPQHIVQRYSAEEIEQAFAPQLNRMKQLEEEVQTSKIKLKLLSTRQPCSLCVMRLNTLIT